MKLTGEELAQLTRIVDRIYEGRPAPRAHGAVGQFLRGCERGRLDVQHVLARHGLKTRDAGWVPGDEAGPIDLRLLGELETAVPSDVWGPVEGAPVISEQLGRVAELTLWTDARTANSVRVLFSHNSDAAVRLSGRYRWFAPGRITPGDARAEAVTDDTSWKTARCLKAVAEDVGRPPHALEYVFDYRLGRPGLKVFRTFAGRSGDGFFDVLPATTQSPRRVRLASAVPNVAKTVTAAPIYLLFAYREPWDDEWCALDATEIDEQSCFDHVLAWADFRAEILGQSRPAYRDIAGIRTALTSADVTVASDPDLTSANLTRSLLSPAASLLRWFRFRS